MDLLNLYVTQQTTNVRCYNVILVTYIVALSNVEETLESILLVHDGTLRKSEEGCLTLCSAPGQSVVTSIGN
jgi:hypothetical protein